MATIDVAGGRQGGAARFLAELDSAALARGNTQIIGRRNSLTPRWLVQRELEAKGQRRIALNNASFSLGDERVVLLRNALHFASREELRLLEFTPSKALRAQIPVIRRLARRATEVVVPCTAMRDRVLRYVPECADRIEVRFHPVGQIRRGPDRSRFRILMPIVNSPYKQLETHLAALIVALNGTGTDAIIQVTGRPEDYPAEIAADPRIEFIGVLPTDALASYWAEVGAVYFPTKLEAFGYPLAEARVHGVPVLAIESDQSREIAGHALRSFLPGDPDSLAVAVSEAVAADVSPDPGPFDPGNYFKWLIGGGR